MSDKNYKFGIIGCGRFGKNFIKTINEMDGVQITHMVTSKPENAKLVNNKVKIVSSCLEMCAQAVDGVIVATPPETHGTLMQECAYNLIPVLCEKPMCMDLKEAMALRDYMKVGKIPCLIDHTQLWNPAFMELTERFRNDKVKKIETKVCSYGPFRKDVPMLWDWAPHDLSMCLSLLKEMPTKIKASLVPHENYDNSGELNIELVFKHTTANIKINNLSSCKYRTFIGTSPFMTLTMFGEELFQTRGQDITQLTVSNERPLFNVVNAFIHAIERGSYEGLDLAVDVIKIIEKCQKSIEKESEYILLAEK